MHRLAGILSRAVIQTYMIINVFKKCVNRFGFYKNWLTILTAQHTAKSIFQVVCGQLGFADGKALSRNSLGLKSFGSLTALGSVTRVGCSGSESSLSNCSMETTDICEFHGSILGLAAVICYDTPVSEVNMSKLSFKILIFPNLSDNRSIGNITCCVSALLFSDIHIDIPKPKDHYAIFYSVLFTKRERVFICLNSSHRCQ